MFCDFWLGSQGGYGVLAKVIMQANIALSYSACDMLWANENSKLEKKWLGHQRGLGVFAKVFFQSIPHGQRQWKF